MVVMKKFVLLLLSSVVLSVLSVTSISAQDFTRSVSPHRDSLEVKAFRAHLDSIRQHRPTVALVLSGGGAKGAAHVGVFQYLDSLNIPVDFIIGTSMGGLMGSLKAMGYPTTFIDSLIRGIDWNMMMRDKLPREYVSYSETKYKEKYLLSMPFFYPDGNDSSAKRDDDIPRKHGRFTLDANDDDSSNFLKDNILGSLPSGYVYGQNVNNLLNSVTVGYQDSVSFVNLPIPFACVATDLASGKTKVWYDGKLNTALRTTMSIPGVFAPVRMDGMILVDGGMRDNYPTTLAKQLGADIIIGVDVSAPSKEYSEIRFIGDIISQSMDMWGRDVYEKNVSVPDVTIKPDITGYSSLSFSKENIDKLIANGYEAAKQQDSALVAVKNRLKGAVSETKLDGYRHSIVSHPVRIKNVDILGVNSKEKEMLLDNIVNISPGELLTVDKISDIVAQIYATQCFDYVAYELHGQDEPYELAIICRRGPTHHLGVGVRADSEEIAAALVNVGLWAHKLRGSTLDLNARISANPYFQMHYSLNLPKVPTLNAISTVRWSDMKMFRDKYVWNTLDYTTVSEDIFLSGLRWSFFDFKVGVRGDFCFDLDDNPFLSALEGYYPMTKRNYYLRPYANVLADTFDDGYFPTKGWKVNVGYEWTMTHNKTPEVEMSWFHTASVEVAGAVSIGKVFTWIPRLNMRYLFGSSGVPIIYSNFVGGMIDGRYMDQQVAFAGTTKLLPMGNVLNVVNSDFRFRLVKNHYLSGLFSCSYSASDISSFLNGQWNYGTALQYSYDTIFGPISLNVHWSNLTKRVGFYASVGYNF